MNTFMAKPAAIERKWYVVDAADKPLGRVASTVATLLRGKHKPVYTPHVDTGDHVIVINASKVLLTGNKLDQKTYRYHTGYPGGLRQVTYRKLMATRPEFVIKHAVKGMLPRNTLGRGMLSKLRIVSGAEHKHQAQQPEVYEI